MKCALLLVLASASCTFAQEKGNVVYQTNVIRSAGFEACRPILGSRYSATITTETVQTLADVNRLVQPSTGTTAPHSQGRTGQDTFLPSIGNLSSANAPHLS